MILDDAIAWTLNFIYDTHLKVERTTFQMFEFLQVLAIYR